MHRAALERNGLREVGIIAPVIGEALDARGLQITATVLSLESDAPRGALASFRRETLKPEDLACMRGTLGIIENDLPRIAARANTWAVGDVGALRGMPDAQARVMACMSAWTASGTAREPGIADVESKVGAV